MSFAHDVKAELCSIDNSLAFKKAELYGLLIFARSFREKSLALQTEHEGVARITALLLTEIFAVRPVIKTGKHSDGHRIQILTLNDSGQAGKIYKEYGYNEKTLSLRINLAVIDEDDCIAAFVRGAFLSCGSIVDPGKDYHLEFVTSHLHLCRDLSYILAEQGFKPKTIRRKGSHIVYFKDSGQIEDLMTFMGASLKSLELMNIKVYKDFRNRANRVTNCETANIDKTVNASTDQVGAIRKLFAAYGPDYLPDELREVANLRVENPDMSLRELGEMLPDRLSRSGVNHRLHKILALAAKLNNKDHNKL